MRHFLLGLIFLLLGNWIYGGVVSEEQARRVAVNWLNSTEPKSYLEDDIESVYVHSLKGFPSLYVVNFHPEGWVMVSGHDVAEPVLAYSQSSVFDIDSIPVQMHDWIEGFSTEIKTAVDNNIQASPQITQRWQKIITEHIDDVPLKSATATNAGPLLESRWNQGRYYNEMAPIDPMSNTGNSHVWIGCVATAMAQTMKYWEYPVHGSGQHNYTHPKYGLQSVNFEDSYYNWSSIPDQPTSLNEEVQKINYHAAVAVNMDFGPFASGAYLEDARDAMVNFFRYNSTLFRAFKNEWDAENDWKNQLKSEIDKGRPVIYAGYNLSGNSGHAFVCDGYINDYFHFNWGWGGYANGNFLLSALTPGSSNYTYNQSAIFGIEPVSVKTIPSPYIEGFDAGSEGYFSTFGKAAITSDQKHTGSYSLRLSQQGFSSYSNNSASLAFIVPSDGNLSFWVKRVTPVFSSNNAQQAFLMPLNGSEPLHVFFNESVTDDEWVNYTLNLSGYTGQAVRLLFVQQNFDHFKEQWMYIDDVSITGTHQNLPPFTPSNPMPANDALSIAHAPKIKWSGGDLNGDQVTYSVYFGTSNEPALAANTSNNEFYPGLLEHSTKYFWRIESSDGEISTSGPVWSFTTRGIPPQVGICATEQIQATSAIICGEIIDDHDARILSRGICWNLKGNPTIFENSVESTDTTPLYYSQATGLSPYTRYYVRSYAISNEGTAYSDQMTIFTLPDVPVVQQLGVISAFRNRATISGTVHLLNDSLIISRGVVWGQKPDFDKKLAFGNSETGLWNTQMLFEMEIDHLPGPDTIYVSVFAENSVGKAYSEVQQLVLFNNAPTIDLDIDNSTAKPETDYSGTVHEQLPGGFIADTDVLIHDLDGDTLRSVFFSLVNTVHGQNEYLRYLGTYLFGLEVEGNNSSFVKLTSKGNLTNVQWAEIISGVELFIDVDAPDVKIVRQVEVWADDGFDQGPKSVAFMQVIPINDPPICVVLPTLSHVPVFGDEISVVGGTWNDALDECSGEMSFSYQWQVKIDSVAFDIENENKTNLIISEKLCGFQVRVVEKATDSFCGGENAVEAKAYSEWQTLKKAAQTLVFDPIPAQQFNQNSYVLSASASSGLPIFYSSASEIIDISADSVFFNSTGRAAIAAIQFGNECFFPSETLYRVMNIDKGIQYIEPNIENYYPYNTGPHELNVGLNSGLEPVIESSNTNVVEVIDGLMHLKGTGTSTLTISQPGNENFYPASPVEVLIEVGKAHQIISLMYNNEIRFGEPPLPFELVSNSSLPLHISSLNPDILDLNGTYFKVKGTGEALVSVSNQGNENWLPVDTLISVKALKGWQKIVFPDSVMKQFNDDSFIIEGSSNAKLDFYFELEDNGVLLLKDRVFTIESAGSAQIKVFNQGDEYWEAVQHFIEVLVAKGSQTINFSTLPNMTFNDRNIQIEANTTAGLVVSFVSLDTAFARIVDNNWVEIVNAGSVSIKAIQNGNENWEAAPPVEQILNISKANQTIVAHLPDTLIVGMVFPAQVFETNSGLPIDNLASSNSNIVEIINDSLIVKNPGQVTLTAIQIGDMNHLPVTELFSFQVQSKVGINKNSLTAIKVYPNPATNSIVVDIDQNYPNNGELIIYTLTGQCVISEVIDSQKNEVNIESLVKGVYILNIVLGKHLFVERLVVK